jgi:predicted nucleotidyltransferase
MQDDISLWIEGLRREYRRFIAFRLTNVLIMSTFVPVMSTNNRQGVAEELLGRTRAAVLSTLYLDTEPSMYVREIIRATGISPGGIQRELRNLERLNLVVREEQGNQVHYRANKDHPIFEDLRRLLLKITGVVPVIEEALKPLGSVVHAAFLYGSFARGDITSSSDIDLMVIGEVTFKELSQCLSQAEKELSRELNPTVYPPSEFREKLQAGHHFLTSIMKGEKMMLIGREDELRRMAGQQMGD